MTKWTQDKDGQGEANAPLIAEPPPETAAERDRLKEINAELLAALEALMWRFEADDADPHSSTDDAPDIQQARAAIAKARGEG